MLAQKGYDITIFESKEKIGGVLRYGIPEFRLPKSILDKYRDKLLDLDIKIRPNTAIGTTITVDDMFRDGYKAIFVEYRRLVEAEHAAYKGRDLGKCTFCHELSCESGCVYAWKRA